MQSIKRAILVGMGLLCGVFAAMQAMADDQPAEADALKLQTRLRLESVENAGRYHVSYEAVQWDPKRTAVIVCDMWQKHWCEGAIARGNEISPRINDFINAARRRGVLIIHAPSSGMKHYEGHPARLRAQEAPKADDLPDGIAGWCRHTERESNGKWPIDQSDGGCDCQPKCPYRPMDVHQTEAIKISDRDAISDSGVECWNLLQQRGIENVIIAGVHTNMCVIGRPFGLRNLSRFGKNVVLARDLTDTMYNPRAWPHVSHFQGTDLIVEHIEKYVCPTITSDQLLGGVAMHFRRDRRPHAVVVIGEDHRYEAPRTMNDLAAELVREYGFRCTVLQATSRVDIPGLETLEDADLAIFYIRRRLLPTRSMRYVRDYLGRGKPLIAFRTTSHAFALREGSSVEGRVSWADFDGEVLGCHYNGYTHGATEAAKLPAAVKHPILRGIEGPYRLQETLYRSSPLGHSCEILMMGKCVDGPGEDSRYRKPKDTEVPDQPVAWTNTYENGGRVFYTSMGSGQTFEQPWFKHMVINAVFWAIDKPVSKPLSERKKP